MSADLDRRMEVALDTAWQAGRITLGYFQRGIETEWKADESPVTQADREAEQKVRQLIEAAFPEDGIVGEEFGNKVSRSGNNWLVDPIDGTKSFVHGVPFYGVLIACQTPEEVVLGAVYLPALDEMVWAQRGSGCWWNGRRTTVSQVEHLEEACLCYTSSTSFAAQGRQHIWDSLSQEARMVRGWGDCYGHILVATGRAEACFDPIMNPWDCGPLLPILEEAGGTFTDWGGTATIHGKDAFSTNGCLFEAVMAHIEAGEANPAEQDQLGS